MAAISAFAFPSFSSNNTTKTKSTPAILQNPVSSCHSTILASALPACLHRSRSPFDPYRRLVDPVRKTQNTSTCHPTTAGFLASRYVTHRASLTQLFSLLSVCRSRAASRPFLSCHISPMADRYIGYIGILSHEAITTVINNGIHGICCSRYSSDLRPRQLDCCSGQECPCDTISTPPSSYTTQLD